VSPRKARTSSELAGTNGVVVSVDWIVQNVYIVSGTVLVASHYSISLNVAHRVLEIIISSST
jgi:hypothetical protein